MRKRIVAATAAIVFVVLAMSMLSSDDGGDVPELSTPQSDGPESRSSDRLASTITTNSPTSTSPTIVVPERWTLGRRCRLVSPSGQTTCEPRGRLNDTVLSDATETVRRCIISLTCHDYGNNSSISGRSSGDSVSHSTRRMLPFFPFSGHASVWREAVMLNVAPPSPQSPSDFAAAYHHALNSTFEQLEAFSVAETFGRLGGSSQMLFKRFNCTTEHRIRRGALLPMYDRPPSLLFDADVWTAGGGVDAIQYLKTRSASGSAKVGLDATLPSNFSRVAMDTIQIIKLLERTRGTEGVEVGRNLTAANEAEWLVQPDGYPPLTRFAQHFIAATQKAPASIAADASAVDEMCLRSKLFVAETPDHFGFGAGLTMVARALAHAIILKRRLVIAAPWARWTGTESELCHHKGWECFFLPPSPCTFNLHVSRLSDMLHEWRHAAVAFARDEIRALKWQRTRVIWRNHYRSKDLSTHELPDLHPASMSRQDVERLTGRTYDDWAMSQMLRYLMRGLQPWAEEMILAHSERSGYPWLSADKSLKYVVAAHHRNGEALKDKEIAPIMKCARVDPSLSLFLVEQMARALHHERIAALPTATCRVSSDTETDHKREILLHFSFDQPSIIEEAARFWREDETRPNGTSSDDCVADIVPLVRSADVSVAAFPRFRFSRHFGDSRETMKRVFSAEHVTKVSLVNLYLSVAADAWTNNDASNWCYLIGQLRTTVGDSRHRAPYLDIVQLVKQEATAHIVAEFCALPYVPKKAKTKE